MAENIKPLTSLRGIAALMILFHHALVFLTQNLGDSVAAYTHFFKNGYLWVDFFSILSGFILTHVYATIFVNDINSFSYRSFLFSRFARLYPLHLFILLLFMSIELLKLIIPDDHPFIGNKSLVGLISNVLLLQATDLTTPPLFGEMTYWNEPAWSISAEWLIYLLFPFLIVLLHRRKSTYNLALYLVAWSFLLIVVELTWGSLDFLGLPSLARCGLECIVGILTYNVYQKNILRHHMNINSLLFASMGWIILVMHHDWHDLLIIPAFCLLFLTAAIKNESNDSFMLVALNSRLMIYVGTISYSIYMVHWFIQESIWRIWKIIFKTDYGFGGNLNAYQSVFLMIGYTLTVLVVASLAYRLIEEPMRVFLKNSTLAKKHLY